MPLGCIVCTALIVSKPLVYPYANGNFGHSRVVGIYIQRGASLVVVSFVQAISYEPQIVKRVSNSAGLHAFFLSLHYFS